MDTVYCYFQALKIITRRDLPFSFLQTVAFKSFSKREQNVFVKQFLHLAQSVKNIVSP